MNYNKKITSNKNINNNRHSLILNNKLSINLEKVKSKSISKFLLNKNSYNEQINTNNEILDKQENNEISPEKYEKSKRMLIYKSSKDNRHQIKSNLPYVSNFASQINNTSTKKINNNFIGIYNITPLVLPFIGPKQKKKE